MLIAAAVLGLVLAVGAMLLGIRKIDEGNVGVSFFGGKAQDKLLEPGCVRTRAMARARRRWPPIRRTTAPSLRLGTKACAALSVDHSLARPPTCARDAVMFWTFTAAFPLTPHLLAAVNIGCGGCGGIAPAQL